MHVAFCMSIYAEAWTVQLTYHLDTHQDGSIVIVSVLIVQRNALVFALFA